MNNELQIDQMSINEKLQAMEALWDNLCHHDGEIPSPTWHSKVLAEREKDLNEGPSKLLDWNKSKINIRKACDENQNP